MFKAKFLKINRSGRRLTLFSVIFATLLICFCVGQFAEAATTGTVSADVLNVRSSPGTGGELLGTLVKNTTVTILGTADDETSTTDENGDIYKWYKISYGSSGAYVRSDYITNVSTSDTDAEGYIGVISVLNGNVNIRSAAGTSNSIVATLPDSTVVNVLGSTTVSGVTWYNIQMNDGTTGYIHSSYIRVSSVKASEVTTDSEFESYIQANFPSSYWEKLRTLHIIYPKWSFVPYSGGSWSSAVTAETRLGWSLVNKTAISSWKSTNEGAYNWETGIWTPFDGTAWVQASDDAVRYFLDPRNFLGPDNIFQFLYQGYDSATQPKDGLTTMVSGTFLSNTDLDVDNNSSNGTTTYVDAIYTAGSTYSVNPYILAAMIFQEVGRDGNSGSVTGTVAGYEGLYNFYNVGSYTTETMSAIERGLWYAGGGSNGSTTYMRPWNTRYRSIMGGAQIYYENYIAQGQTTLYTKKFNVAPTGNKNQYEGQYMTYIGGGAAEGRILSEAYSDAMCETSLVFYIPTYEGLPETACAIPTKDGSPNNKLSSLAVDGYTLTPAYAYATTEYSLVVDYSVSTVGISASSFDSTASISVSGTPMSSSSVAVPLKTGVNAVNVDVTAQNGDVNTYTITIARQPDTSGTSVSTDVYTMTGEGFIKKIQTSTTIAEFKNGFTLTDDAYIGVTTSSGGAKSDDSFIGSGDIVTFYYSDGSVYSTYQAFILGDINGDGKISNSDLIKIRNHILGTSSLSDLYAVTADINGDSKVSNSDLIKVRNHILQTTLIEQ